MSKKILTGILVVSHIALDYSVVRCVNSIRRFKDTVNKIDFSGLRKDTNHLNDMVETRNA